MVNAYMEIGDSKFYGRPAYFELFHLANNTEVTLGETESTKKKDEKIESTTEKESTKKN